MFLLRFLVDSFMSSQNSDLPLIQREEYLKDPTCRASQDPFITGEDYAEILGIFGLEELGDRIDYNAHLIFTGPETVQNLQGQPSLSLHVKVHGGGETSVFSLIGRHTEFHAAIKQSEDGEYFQLDHIHIRDYGASHEIGCGALNGNQGTVERLVHEFLDSVEYLQRDVTEAIQDPEVRLAKRLRPVLQDMSALAHRTEPVEISQEIIALRP